MLGLQSCGNVEFLLNHVNRRNRKPQCQRSAEETVQQREFLVLPVEICLECFHGGLRSIRALGSTFRERIGSSAGNKSREICVLISGFPCARAKRPVKA